MLQGMRMLCIVDKVLDGRSRNQGDAEYCRWSNSGTVSATVTWTDPMGFFDGPEVVLLCPLFSIF